MVNVQLEGQYSFHYYSINLELKYYSVSHELDFCHLWVMSTYWHLHYIRHLTQSHPQVSTLFTTEATAGLASSGHIAVPGPRLGPHFGHIGATCGKQPPDRSNCLMEAPLGYFEMLHPDTTPWCCDGNALCLGTVYLLVIAYPYVTKYPFGDYSTMLN